MATATGVSPAASSNAATASESAKAGGPQQQEVKLESLSIDQLQRLRKQLEEEVALIRNNIGALTTALDRFSTSLEAVKSLQDGDNELMIPLSSSMYARGRTKSNGKVMIDLGTGFFTKVPNEEGQAILNRKIEYIAKNRKAFQEDLKRKMLLVDQVTALLQEKVRQRTAQQ